MNTTTLDLTADTIDVRDIIARVEEIGDVVDLVGDISEEYETLTANVRTDYTPVDIDGVTYWFR